MILVEFWGSVVRGACARARARARAGGSALAVVPERGNLHYTVYTAYLG